MTLTLQPIAGRMQPGMHRQCPAVYEGLATGGTLERSFAGMSPSVDNQITAAGEVLPTDLALIRPDSLVRSLDVSLQVLVITIGPLADVTLKRPIRLYRLGTFTGRVTLAFLFRSGRTNASNGGHAKRKGDVTAGVNDRLLDWQLGFGLLLFRRFGIRFL